MEIEVAYAGVKQILIKLEISPGTTIAQAILLSGILAELDNPATNNAELTPIHGLVSPTEGQVAIESLTVGIFGKVRSLDWELNAGDRVEIYRPLRVDPKVARLEKAKKQQQAKRQAKAQAKKDRAKD